MKKINKSMIDVTKKFFRNLYENTRGIVDRFYNSNFSFYFFISLMLIGATIQLLIFIFIDGFIVNGTSIGNKDSWAAWTYIFISLPAVILGFVGWVYITRVDSKFLIPASSSILIVAITSLIGGMIWSAMAMLISVLSIFYKKYLIDTRGQEYTLSKNYNYIVLVFIIVFFSLGIIFINVESLNFIWWRNEVKTNTLSKYVDVVGATLLALGYLLLVSKNRWAFIVLLINNFIFLFIFYINTQYLNSFQSLIYIFANIMSLFANNHTKKQLQ